MVILGTRADIAWIRNRCDGRCADGQWCIFADGPNADACPVDNDTGCIEVKKNKFDMLEVVGEL